MGNLGMPELMMIMFLALLLFGPKKLPEIGKQVGKALGEFKRASNDLKRSIQDEMDKAQAGPRLDLERPAEARAEARATRPRARRRRRGSAEGCRARAFLDADDAVVTEEAPRREDGEEELPRMSFLEHLEDLRKRLFISALAIAVGFLLCWWKSKEIFQWLEAPVLSALPPGTKLAYTQLTEPFMLYINIALLAGVFVASPVIVYPLWLFIAPGLY